MNEKTYNIIFNPVFKTQVFNLLCNCDNFKDFERHLVDVIIDFDARGEDLKFIKERVLNNIKNSKVLKGV